MDHLALAVEIVATLLTASGMAYHLLALFAARSFRTGAPGAASAASSPQAFAPPVSILKPLKGVDPRMYAGLVSHCTQIYPGAFELLFGVGSLDDPAVALIGRLCVEYPDVTIRMVLCEERLGPNGKVSSLVQLLPQARFEHILVNDSDIRVAPSYLLGITAPFRDSRVGLVTAPYIGLAEPTLPSRLEALGISTDFLPGVLTARQMEGGIRFGLGSTLATTRTALAAIGGFEALLDQLADDYELGARLAAQGFHIELVHEVVATSVPAYTWAGFCAHQLRWARSTRDSRRLGYLGLGVTYVLPWAAAVVLASGFALWSLSLFAVALLLRVLVALTVGVGILRDGQVLRDLPWLPVRDGFGLFFWAWSYASDEVVWRGERFRLRHGQLVPV